MEGGGRGLPGRAGGSRRVLEVGELRIREDTSHLVDLRPACLEGNHDRRTGNVGLGRITGSWLAKGRMMEAGNLKRLRGCTWCLRFSIQGDTSH